MRPRSVSGNIVTPNLADCCVAHAAVHAPIEFC
jgi:hypothetical protein